MAAVTIITPEMRAHIAGCRDIKREMAQLGAERVATYEGADLLAAILTADDDLASWFGCDAYDPNAGEECWTVDGCDWAPCLLLEVTKAGIKFDDLHKPYIAK